MYPILSNVLLSSDAVLGFKKPLQNGLKFFYGLTQENGLSQLQRILSHWLKMGDLT